MSGSIPLPATAASNRSMRWGGWLLMALGLMGHLYAANAIGGSRIAYTHHILGFGLILVVTGGLIAGLGYLFWRSHPARTLLAIGVVQALFGLWIALGTPGVR